MNPFRFLIQRKSKKKTVDAPPTLLQLEHALQSVIDPYLQKDWISTKSIKDLLYQDGIVTMQLELGYPAQSQHDVFKAMISEVLLAIPGVLKVKVEVTSKITPHAVQQGVALLPKIKNIIAVASAKGGVGKSTTAVNLALALAKEGARVGVLDADIYGPSQPLMLGVVDQVPKSPDNKHIEPLENHGVQVMSMGFLVDQDQPMVWRGPMVTRALQQLLHDTLWDDLDYLVVDLPPGTGDIQLTLSQKIPVTGAVIVTTPQDIALLDARRGLKMFEKVGIPVLGVVENMSMHICSKCGHHEALFGSGGGVKMSEDFQVSLLGQLPLLLSIRETTDQGRPIVVAEPESEATKIYMNIARRVAAQISEKARGFTTIFPKVVLANTEK